MKGKVITFIGVILMILVAASYILFEAFVQDTSNVTAQNVVVARSEVPEGTVIHNFEEAQRYFTIKRMASDDIVEGSIIVNSSDLGGTGLISKIEEALNIQTATEDELKQLIGYKITRNYAVNEQVLVSYLSTDITEFDADERIYAIETSYSGSVAAEINEGDYVDLWLVTNKNNQTISQKLIGPLKIYKLKTSDNVTITSSSTAVPSIVLFKLDEETIQYISTMRNEGTVFFVKYGVSPTQDDVDKALENAQSADETTDESAAQTTVTPTPTSGLVTTDDTDATVDTDAVTEDEDTTIPSTNEN